MIKLLFRINLKIFYTFQYPSTGCRPLKLYYYYGILSVLRLMLIDFLEMPFVNNRDCDKLFVTAATPDCKVGKNLNVYIAMIY